MAYDELLANRIRRALGDRQDISERRMFGGLAFLYHGRMCCGIVGGDLMVRVPAEEFDAVLRRPHARPMDFTGKPLTGFVYVSPAGVRTAAALRAWLALGQRVAEAKAAGDQTRRPRAPTRSPVHRPASPARRSKRGG